MRIAIIGGGAAGCFAAIEIKRRLPSADVTIFEAGKRLLAKVAITGGGRCNLTNSFADVKNLATVYPRGERLMKRLLKNFSHEDAFNWFEHEGVHLVTQADQCVFPQSQDAMEIVNTLARLIRTHGIKVVSSTKVEHIVACRKTDDGMPMRDVLNGFDIVCKKNASSKNPSTNNYCQKTTTHYDIVLVTTGGSPRRAGLSFLDGLGLDLVDPVPSLFSLCIADSGLKSLMGTVVEDVTVSLPATKMRASGAILLTHWGASGPAVLRLSSYAARILHDKDYRGQMAINWFGNMNEAEVCEEIGTLAAANIHKQLASAYPERLNSRLWLHLLSRAGLRHNQRWGELGRKSFNRLASILTNDTYSIDGKNRFKDEFVTCGGVSLGNLNPNTLECRTLPHLFFAGEVVDVDAITGGFNLQAAWTMAYVAAQSISELPICSM